ncbi:MAG TPA: S41 family peptidase [Deinococcales bacterium]|nr:S41 family peptidase [Deinococcales bacterium]
MIQYRHFRKHLAATLVAAVLPIAAASPAQNLFDQATRYFSIIYYGYSSAPYQAFASKYQSDLDAACSGKGDACPFDAAVPLVQKMVAELNDKHTYYLTPDANADRQRAQAGLGSEKPKIGVTLGEVTGSNDVVIVDVIEGGPGQRAGLARGDRVSSVNGTAASTFKTPLEFRQALIAAVGEGKAVRLLVSRGGAAPRELAVTGEVIAVAAMPSLRYIPNNLAVLRIPSFQSVGKVAQRVHDLVREAQERGVAGLILDMRDNGGGAVTDMIATAGAFLPNVGFIESYKDGSTITQWQDGRISRGEGAGFFRINRPALWTGPLVVLINSRSGSAPEYVAQFIQDAKRGIVIGEATAGVANTIVQSFPLPDRGALTVTIGRSLRLDRTPLPEKVNPDRSVKDDLDVLASTGQDLVLEAAIKEFATSQANR